VKVGVWCAVSARRNVAPLFFKETITKNIYMYAGQHFQHLLWPVFVTTSFQTLSADSLAKFPCSLQPAVHQSP
jgi:hypothetical protein